MQLDFYHQYQVFIIAKKKYFYSNCIFLKHQNELFCYFNKLEK